MKKVIIAEKPSVAREISTVLNVTNKSVDGTYFYSNEFAITWAFGHLVTLCDPEEYRDTWKNWNMESLPIVPEEFKLTPTFKYVKDKENKFVKIVDEGVKKQLAAINTLFTNADEIIVATDAGREGELIFRLIYNYLKCNVPFKRLWISSLTKEAIKKGFNDLQDGRKYDNLYNSAFARSKADWLLGLNATRALTVVAKSTFPLGRVQTPTLCLITERYLDNKKFVPQKYYQIKINLLAKGVHFFALSTNTFVELDAASRLTNELNTKSKVLVKSVTSKVRNENPPLLFDLTQLQADCNRKYGLSANDTLEIAQKMYESKMITYPRTSSRYISEDIFNEIPDLLQSCKSNISSGNYPSLVNAISYLEKHPLNKISVNDNKVTDHHAILPTNYQFDLSKLDAVHRDVYELILSRSIEAFHAVCVKNVTTITFNEQQQEFLTKGVVILQKGWRSVLEEKEELDENEMTLPELQMNEEVELEKAENVEKTTKPKPVHNEASLLKLMESAGKDIVDDEIREAMKEGGLGTPATRASIIEGLLSRKYITREKKSLVPTEKGIALYEFVKDKLLGKPDLTGQWELKLSKVEKGEFNVDNFMVEIVEYTQEIINEIKEGSNVVVSSVLVATEKENESKPDCPACKKSKMNLYAKGLFCIDKGCNYVIWRNQRSRDLTDNQLFDLAIKKKTKSLKFQSKEGKEYEGFLVLNSSNKVELEFKNKK